MHSTFNGIDLIGAPTDIGAGVRGASMGPEALRVAGLAPAIAALGLDVQDVGDVSGPLNPQQVAMGGYRHLPEVSAWVHAVHQRVDASLGQQRMPILVGGDHSLAIGSISAVAKRCKARGKKLRVLWLDAHSDINTATLTPSGNIHGMPIACLMGEGPATLVDLGGAGHRMQASQLRQIGIRSVDAGEKRLVRDWGIDVFDMRYIDDNGMRQTMAMALEGVDANTHLHVSLDVDFLDPDIAPGVGTAVRGGPTYREAHLCMEMIADTHALASLDIMELCPALDVRNQTAELVVDLIESLFGKSTLMRNRSA